MSERYLPVHPATGLHAIGLGKRGPIWPVAGGAPDDDQADDKRDDKRDGAGLTMTYSQAINRIAEIEARMTELAEMVRLTPEQDSEYQELRDEVFQVDEHRKRLERADELAQVKRVKGQADVSVRGRQIRIVPGSTQAGRGDYDRDAILEPDSIEDARFRNPWDLSEVRQFGASPAEVAGEYRARALCAMERVRGTSDNVRQAATTILERFDDDKSTLSRQCLATSSPAYMRAWSKLARMQQNSLTTDEIKAIDQVRAMSLTDAAGGFLVPFQLDPTVIITSDGKRSDIRQIARTVVATGDVWNGVSAGNVSWSWDAEAAEVSDDTPTFAQPSIPNHKAAGFVPISIEALQDESNVTSEVGQLLAGGKTDLEATAFITGSGNGQPKGVITAIAAVAGSITAAAADDTFAIGDVYKVQGALPARYRANASWLANNLIYNLIRAFGATYGSSFWVDLSGDTPARLLGRGVYEAEAMDGEVTTAGAVANYILLLGSFDQFVITDRVGMSVEFIPHLFATGNNRPSGQRGWYAHYRTGSDVTNAGAFRLLNVASAG